VRNPLDLSGPDFLVFYALFALVTLGLLYVARVAGESGAPPRIDTGDPYLIAYLRGGTYEALRVATIALIDRGLLLVDDKTRTVVAPAQFTKPQHPIEQVLMRHFEQSHLATTVFGNDDLTAACAEYERRLAALGLVPDAARRATRRRLLGAALLVLVGLSVAKIAVALARGRSNVLFLVVLSAAAGMLAARVATPRLTSRGRALLADLRRLFARLRVRAPSVNRGGASADIALLAAVFGLAALPWPAFAYAQALYPKAGSSSLSPGWSSCGSSGGSSSCGSSSSCGGGGSGCGGCGGGGGGD
jgi:uncharacterized protein (TIGR04222 family)